MTDNNFKIESAAITDRGLSEKRPQNEDSYLEINESGIFAVADGVGGAQAGDVASQMATEILGEAFANLQPGGDAEEMMKIAIERANEAIFQMSHDLAQLSTMATTVVALHINENIATIGHVGDSRLYRLDPHGSLFRETEDHSVVEEEVRAGRMTAEQAANHPSRNVISRALGADSTVEVDMKTIMFEPDTTFFLCSDGITRHIDDFQLRELLLSGESPETIVQRMKEICYERGAEDNLTAVIAKVTDEAKGNAAIITTPSANEFEEPTVASTRPIVPPLSSAAGEEVPAQSAQIPESGEFQTDQANQETFSGNSESDNSMSFRAAASENASDNTAAPPREVGRVEKSYAVEEKTVGGFGRLLTSLLLIALGGVIGAGAYHFLMQNHPPAEPPQLTQMQTPNIEYSAFEDNRRAVDRDPNAFINTNANITQDAEGLYLVGRAYLLTQKFPEAKKYFEEAKNKLSQSGNVNSKILTNEIAMGLAIINNEPAKQEFMKQLAPEIPNANVNANANINANTNANTSVNMNANVNSNEQRSF